MDKILKDPSISTNMVAPAISWTVWTAMVICGFTMGVGWLVVLVQIVIWLLTALSVFIGIGYFVIGADAIKDNTLPLRLPKWWLPVTAITSTCVLWFFSGGIWWMTGLWMFSRIALALNYQAIEEIHDTRYTKGLASKTVTRKEAMAGIVKTLKEMGDIINKKKK